MKREVMEETGLEVKVEKFLGVYTKDRFDSYPNGDKAYVILFVFVCRAIGGTFDAVDGEAAQLRYFDLKDFPPTFHHAQPLKDYIDGKEGVIR